MGTNTHSTMADNSWAAADLDSSIAPLAVGGGIYDFSGTVADHVYAEIPDTNITKDQIAIYAKTWWDGSSPKWSSEDEFAQHCKDGLKLVGGVVSRGTLMRRAAFGEGDCCHIITAQEKKKGIIVAHADYTCIVGIFDQEQNKPAGPLAMAIEELCKSYKDQGY